MGQSPGSLGRLWDGGSGCAWLDPRPRGAGAAWAGCRLRQGIEVGGEGIEGDKAPAPNFGSAERGRSPRDFISERARRKAGRASGLLD